MPWWPAEGNAFVAFEPEGLRFNAIDCGGMYKFGAGGVVRGYL